MSKKIDEAWESFSKSVEVHDHAQLLKEGWKSLYDMKGPRQTLLNHLTNNPNFESRLFRVARGSKHMGLRFFRPITQ